jgi:hypothetical protein
MNMEINVIIIKEVMIMDFEKIKKRAIDIFEVIAEPTVDVVSSMFLEGIAGTFVPGVASVVLGYKQKRQERMLEKFMEETQARQEELEKKIIQMSEEKMKEFTSKYFGIVTDYVLDEVQEEKIKYIVNGFINLASIEDIKEDFVFSYYDILIDLRVVDLGVLKLYHNYSQGNLEGDFRTVLEEFNLDYDQYKSIQNKLLRMGLLISNNETNERDNQLKIQKYLEQLEKGKKVKLGNLKNISSNDSFKLSPFGRQFMNFFVEEY